MNKTIALVTLQDSGNIGNRLQNYALQTVLEEYDCTVYNLDNGFGSVPPLTGKQWIKMQAKGLLGLCGKENYKKQYLSYKSMPLRRTRVSEFNQRFIHHIVPIAWDGTCESPVDMDAIDLGIVGSDQVWHRWKENVVSSETELEFYYLTFLPAEKRTAYAASFGFSEFPAMERPLHEKGLKGMCSIACREQSGCKLVRDVTGKEVPHVLDPTLLLGAASWRRLAEQADDYAKELSAEPYVLTFFLGDITKEYRGVIEKESCGRRIIDFMNYADEKMMRCGPLEFLYLIDHADCIYTDSFHCTVFGILLKKQFMAFRRQENGFTNMFGRIEELLISTGHGDCAYGGVNESCAVEGIDTLKECSLQYLEAILGI